MRKRSTKRSLQVLYIVAALFVLAMTLQVLNLHPQLAAGNNGIAFSLN
jgi:hypothetical protein